MGRLEGSISWITGGGRGIGRAIALEMAREGADIAVNSRTESELNSMADEVKALGRRAFTIKADVMNLADIRAAAKEILRLPDGVEPIAFTPLGYPADQHKPKTRQPLEELVRYEHWSIYKDRAIYSPR